MGRRVISEYLADPDTTMSEAMWELEQVGIRISCDREIRASGSSRPDQSQQLGLERVEQVRTRINQDYFRSVLLSNYGGTCCLTGIDIPALLTASHIKPWAAAMMSGRLMSSNGILLNALHDCIFERYARGAGAQLPHPQSNGSGNGPKSHVSSTPASSAQRAKSSRA